MNVHSLSCFAMSTKHSAPMLDRRQQILEAAMLCFAKRGFHQTSMHDISAEAGISVGLDLSLLQEQGGGDRRARGRAQERHRRACSNAPDRRRRFSRRWKFFSLLIVASSRRRSSPLSWSICSLKRAAIRKWRRWCEASSKTKTDGVAGLIARSPEGRRLAPWLDPREIAEMIFALHDGAMMRSVFRAPGSSIARQRERQLNVARTLWRLLFSRTSHANGHN